jgi:hypothetical protein
LAGLRLAAFFLVDGFAAFFAARFLVAISSGSFRFSTLKLFLVYPPGAADRGETTTSKVQPPRCSKSRVSTAFFIQFHP